MDEDILKYLPTVMFRGTPCMLPIAGQTTGLNFFEGTQGCPGGDIG